eukprot:PhM_4_TR5844/c0_g1_i1/m.22922
MSRRTAWSTPTAATNTPATRSGLEDLPGTIPVFQLNEAAMELARRKLVVLCRETLDGWDARNHPKEEGKEPDNMDAPSWRRVKNADPLFAVEGEAEGPTQLDPSPAQPLKRTRSASPPATAAVDADLGAYMHDAFVRLSPAEKRRKFGLNLAIAPNSTTKLRRGNRVCVWHAGTLVLSCVAERHSRGWWAVCPIQPPQLGGASAGGLRDPIYGREEDIFEVPIDIVTTAIELFKAGYLLESALAEVQTLAKLMHRDKLLQQPADTANTTTATQVTLKFH